MHEIPKGRYSSDSEVRVNLSSDESVLAPQTKRFIEENMLDFALKIPRDIRQDDEISSTTPSLVLQVLDDPDTHFVENSKQLARNLHQSQTGNSPAGILIVAITGSGASSALVILKAEHQEGMRLQRRNGHVDLEHLNELIVGNNSRVYKIAVLRNSGETVMGQMVDQQNGVAFADFFMATFLGCRLADNAEVQTRQFMKSALQYVNDEVVDEEKQGRYATAIVAYMAAPAETFQASEFADQFLDIDDRDGFIQSLPDDVSSSVISKNLALVPGRGSGLRLYGHGVVISASASALNRGAVEIISESNGETVVKVAGALRRYGLGTAPKD